MTGRAKLTLSVTVLALALVTGILAIVKVTSQQGTRTITVATQPSTRPAYPHDVSASLGRLDLMRQATIEGDMPENARRGLLALADDTHRQITAAMDDDSLAPATRDTRIQQLRQDYTQAMNDATRYPYAQASRNQILAIWFELDLLSRRRLLPLMFEHLEMTPDQHKQADAAFMEMSVILRNEPAGGAPNERSMQAMLTCRDKLHALLTPPQRDKLKQVLRDQQQAREQQLRLSSSTRPSTQGMSRLMRATTQATQPTTRPVLPKISIHGLGLGGGVDITVTPEGTFSYTKLDSTFAPGKTVTTTLNASQIARLATAVQEMLARPSRPESVTDSYVKIMIGEQTWESHDIDDKFRPLYQAVAEFEPQN